jgi:hypothetical protein
MDAKLQQDKDASAQTGYTRLDGRQRAIVNHAMSVQEGSNTMSAIEYLKAHDIDPTVIARVLLEPLRKVAAPQH